MKPKSNPMNVPPEVWEKWRMPTLPWGPGDVLIVPEPEGRGPWSVCEHSLTLLHEGRINTRAAPERIVAEGCVVVLDVRRTRGSACSPPGFHTIVMTGLGPASFYTCGRVVAGDWDKWSPIYTGWAGPWVWRKLED